MKPEFGICHLSIVPVRSEPGDRFEQVNQLLFGEHFTILEISGNWVRICTAHDGYTGWIDSRQFRPLEEAEFSQLETCPPWIGTSSSLQIRKQRPSGSYPGLFEPLSRQFLPMGSLFPFYAASGCRLSGELFTITGQVEQAAGFSPELLTRFIEVMINSPYQWGGRSIAGIDCSGLTQLFCRLAGLDIPRDAADQALIGLPVDSLEETRAGDLAFFHNDSGRIMHVGLITEQGLIFHASVQVRIDLIDQTGIYNQAGSRYTHSLNSFRRLF